MPQDHSFDIVSKVNLQELRNAMQQAQKEVDTRFDFRNSSASAMLEASTLIVKLTADHHTQLRSVRDVVESKLAKRGVPLNALAWQSPEQLPSGLLKQQAVVQQGLSPEKAKELVKLIKGLGLKVQLRIEGDAVRVVGKQRDDLQAVIQALRAKDLGVPLQFENYR